MIFGEAPARQDAVWHPEPNYRGSFNILSTCVLTLVLCIWTSVHLNIPEEDLSTRNKWDPRGWLTRQQWRKVAWLILGLLAPEMVAYTAWSQRNNVKKLSKEIRPFLKTDSERREYEDDMELHGPRDHMRRSHRWTDVHSFFALSGGFVFSTYDLPENERFLPGNRNRVTLSGEVVLWLAKNEPSLLPDLSEADIQDKSKANHLAKAIICVQAMWFMAQCISRVAQGLAISLLELNTFAHTLCALLTYGFWWDKPLDIEEPTQIKGEKMHNICAFLCCVSLFGSRRDLDFGYLQDAARSPVACLPDSFTSQYSDGQTRLYMGQGTDNFLYERRRYFFNPAQGILQISRRFIECSARDKRRWFLARHAREQISEIRYDCLSDRARNWPAKFELFRVFYDPGGLAEKAAISIAGCLYGGLHLLAWAYPFTSHPHHVLWRISALAIAASGPVVTSAHFVAKSDLSRVRWEQKFGKASVGYRLYQPVMASYYAAITAFLLFYVFARAYLVIESFLSLRYLPNSALKQPQWSQYFPHIT